MGSKSSPRPLSTRFDAVRWCAAFAVAATLPLSGWSSEELNVTKLAVHLEAGERDSRRDSSYHLSRMGAEAKEAIPALIKALDDDDRQVWSNSVAALANLGPLAEPAIPALIQGFESPQKGQRRRRQNERMQVMLRHAYALSRIGAPAVQPLIEALKNEDAALRMGAIKALGGMEAVAAPAVPELVKNLNHGDENLRRDLVDAFGLIGKPAVKPLQEALGSPDARTRQTAVLALAAIGRPAAEPASARVLELAEKDQDNTVKGAALAALPRVGAPPDRAVPVALRSLGGSDESVRLGASNAVLLSRAYSEKALPVLIKDLGHADAATRRRAAEVLGGMHSVAGGAVPVLIERARKEPAEAAYTSALAKIGQPALAPLMKEITTASEKDLGSKQWVFRTLKDMGSPAMDALAPALDSPKPGVRAGAARALQGMMLTPKVVKRLSELSSDQNPHVRAATFRTLVQVRSERDQLVPTLEAALDDADPEIRRSAAAALASIGSVAKIGTGGLVDLLSESETATRKAAIVALAGLGKKAESAVPAIAKGLDDPELRLNCVEALGKIGASSASAVPKLVELARSSGDELRMPILTALGDIGQGLDSVLPLLYEAAKDSNNNVRATAVPTLAQVEKDDSKLIPLVLAALKDRSFVVRRSGADAARILKERAEPVVPHLFPMLDRRTELGAALSALYKIPVRTLEPLAKALDHPDVRVRVFACNALGELGAEAQSVVPALEKRSAQDADNVKAAAKKALEKIRAATPQPAPAATS